MLVCRGALEAAFKLGLRGQALTEGLWMRILVVEDDAVLSDGLRVGLSLIRATLDTVPSCADGRAALAVTEFDPLGLDLMLPDGSALDLLLLVRAGADRSLVLLLTALDEV